MNHIWLRLDDLDLPGKQKLLSGLLSEPVTVYPATGKERVDAALTKPNFHYNFKVLQEVLGLTKMRETC
jgi:hypothetical protein